MIILVVLKLLSELTVSPYRYYYYYYNRFLLAIVIEKTVRQETHTTNI